MQFLQFLVMFGGLVEELPSWRLNFAFGGDTDSQIPPAPSRLRVMNVGGNDQSASAPLRWRIRSELEVLALAM